MTGPYAHAADQYWARGWRGILPLPYQRKKDPPAGYTGGGGVDTSWPDVYTWLADSHYASGNIALRLPRDVLGIDVDDYGNKHGGQTLAKREAQWGPLPPTWRTTNRDDGISGIRLFRVPEGLAWPGEVGPSIETVHWGHRYAMAWPSLHPEGRVYRWITPDGLTSTTLPDPDELPELPEAWVMGLTGGVLASAAVRNTFTSEQAQAWLLARPGGGDPPCRRMAKAIEQARTGIARSSAHDSACAGTARIIRLAEGGHSGIFTALADLHEAFLAEVTDPARARRGEDRRTPRAAEKEWLDFVDSAVNLVSADPGMTTCDCAGQLTNWALAGPTSAGALALDTRPLDLPKAPPEQGGAPDTEHTSWWPVDLGPILTGGGGEAPPEVLTRMDGAALFYRSKVNGLLGESESGKTWVGLLGVVQVLKAGGTVVYLDFEDTPGGIVNRLREMGVTDAELSRLHYIGPDETLHELAHQDLTTTITTTRPDLIILDGFNAAMTLLGLDINDNGDATKFAQLVLRPLARSGAAVVYIDHLPKAKENRGKGGIGAQAKRAMTTGCALTVEVTAPFGRGMTGRLELTVDKDRAGHVRAVSGEGKHVGTVIFESDRMSGRVQIYIRPPDNATRTEKHQGRVGLTKEVICQWLASGPERTSVRACREVVSARIGARAVEIDEALEELVREGHVARTNDPKGVGFVHALIRPWSIAASLADKTPQTGGVCPTVSDRVQDTVQGGKAGGVSVPPLPSGGDALPATPGGNGTKASGGTPSGHVAGSEAGDDQ
jgi:hypothetical protein